MRMDCFPIPGAATSSRFECCAKRPVTPAHASYLLRLAHIEAIRPRSANAASCLLLLEDVGKAALLYPDTETPYARKARRSPRPTAHSPQPRTRRTRLPIVGGCLRFPDQAGLSTYRRLRRQCCKTRCFKDSCLSYGTLSTAMFCRNTGRFKMGLSYCFSGS